MSAPASCSAVSLALGEPLAGTATYAPRWLLVEQPGPWGRSAFDESRLDPAVGRALKARGDELGMRVQLMRRPDGTTAARRTCLVADCESTSVRRLVFGDPAELLEVDLRIAGEPVSSPVFAVCTNARRDACCALHGRAVVRAMSAMTGVWETSHVGGHRFAANLLCLPHGYLFGRVSDDGVARAYAEGHVDLGHLRGRVSYPPAAQAAEWFVRQEAGFYGVDDVALEHADGTSVRMLAGGYLWTVEVEGRAADPPRIESCGADELVTPTTYALTAIEAIRA